MKARK